MSVSRSVAALFAFAALVASCGNKRDTSFIVASCHVEATDVRISSKVGGTLEWFPLEEGDKVKEGQVLARIDPVDLRLARDASLTSPLDGRVYLEASTGEAAVQA